MTPVTQRILASTKRGDGHNGLGIAGDCMRAVLASILDLPYEDVPHVCHYPSGYDADSDPLTNEHGALWYRRCRRWLRTLGLDLAGVVPKDLNDPDRWPRWEDGTRWEGYLLATGPSWRGPWNHSVVAYLDSGNVVTQWDPHPSRAGIVEVTDIEIICAPYDPPPPDEAEEARA